MRADEQIPANVAAARAAITRWFQAAVAAADPQLAVEASLGLAGDELSIAGTAVPLQGRLVVLAIGKAAVAMARGAASVLGDRIDAGAILTKDGHGTGPTPSVFTVAEARHPIPDERGVAATEEMLGLIRGLSAEDIVLALISGGGSALLEAPQPPLSLADFAATTEALLRAGAPIDALNAVRRPLSQVKAGGLLRAAAPATVHTLILSDVLGNDPRIIASGPTVPGEADRLLALRTLDQFGVRDQVPAAVTTYLEGTPEASTEPARVGVVAIVADNGSAMESMFASAQADGYVAEIVARNVEGEAADLGVEWVNRALAAPSDLDVLVGGGEATVTVRGHGVGGRNTEFALAAALELAVTETGRGGWVIASLATDGDDGPTGAAGAIADAGTVGRAAAAGVDPAACLVENDSLRVFESAGGLVSTGPTGTNVNDLYVAVRVR